MRPTEGCIRGDDFEEPQDAQVFACVWRQAAALVFPREENSGSRCGDVLAD